MPQTPIFTGADKYSQFLDSFSVTNKVTIDLGSNEISKMIFLDLAKMKHAEWRMKINFKRHKRHAISEFFQDILAFYLNACLPIDYEVELEKKVNKTQADIVIKKNNRYIFIIEVKTTIGYERPDHKSADPYINFKKRVSALSLNFQVPFENIIYVFEDHGNVSKDFSDKFWDKSINKPKPRQSDFPFSIIKPLFNANDPSYWEPEKRFDRRSSYKPFNELIAIQKAELSIVTKFEDIIKQIINAKYQP